MEKKSFKNWLAKVKNVDKNILYILRRVYTNEVKYGYKKNTQ